MPSLPSLAGLEAFEAVSRHRSFTRAAAELHVTQSAVSHRVHALEAQLGAVLFVRTGRRVELTDEGRALAEDATSAFALLREGIERLERSKRGSSLTVSCSPS